MWVRLQPNNRSNKFEPTVAMSEWMRTHGATGALGYTALRTESRDGFG
jgi:hypothetical protein